MCLIITRNWPTSSQLVLETRWLFRVTFDTPVEPIQLVLYCVEMRIMARLVLVFLKTSYCADFIVTACAKIADVQCTDKTFLFRPNSLKMVSP